ncbi:uncharacterized protein LOC123529179 [Mercenaria mercenaria]|uniref:uncharacterized protein LOC123529179 n=1 Tax=Mercenaria mercenaria TaxID=6596 RepID=UPI00234F202B|nr:uncharacterized protein LOC123529179 [Mercenaria mercenaria]
MNPNPEMKKNVGLKAEGQAQIKHISEPFDFKHDLHIGHEDNEERRVGIDDRPVSPPAPCPGNKDKLGIPLMSDANISQVIKEDIIPVLRSEIEDIIEEKIRKILHEHNDESETRHCKTCRCACAGTERPKHEDTFSNPGSDIFSRNPEPCTAIFVEDSDIIKTTTGFRMIAATDIQVIEGERKFLKSFSNPVYHHKGQTLLIQTRHGAKLVKCGSCDIHHVNDESSTRDDISVSSRANTSTVLGKSNQPPALKSNQTYNIKGRRLSKSDERECLANALQWHIKELVDGIVFKDSELPDDLLADGCITEDECADLRTKLDRKDQVRVLLSLVKGRDFDVLKKFLKHLRSHNETVATSVEEKFEQNKKDGKRCSKCAVCRLISQVNLKYIVDDLWRNSLIDDGLFNLIVQTEKPAGAQDELWYGVIYSLNNYCVQCPSDVRHTLGNALRKKHHYNHLAQVVEWTMYTNGELKCRCELQNKIVPFEIFSSMVSSMSPRSSVSEFETDSQSDVSHMNEQTENTKEPEQDVTKLKKKAFAVAQSLQDDILCKDSHSTVTVSDPELDRHSPQYTAIPKIRSSPLTTLKSETETKRLQTDTMPKESLSVMVEINSEIDPVRPSGDNMTKENRSAMTTTKPDLEITSQKPHLANKPVPLKRQSVTRQNAFLNEEWKISDIREHKV